MNTPRTQRLISQTGRRLYLARFGSVFHRAGLIAAAVALLAIILSRLFALLPSAIVVPWVWTLAVAALIATALIVRRPSAKETARHIDEKTCSKELFLTTAYAGQATGEYQDIVLEQAEQRAEALDARKVVGFPWQRGTRNLVISGVLVAAAAIWLPQFDPFKKQEQRNKLTKQEEQLKQTKKATAMRAEQLKEQDAKENDKINQALAALEKTFKEAKPQEREPNLKRLAEHQKEIGEMWRQVANQKRNDAFDSGTQKFGQVNPQQTQQWKEDLKKGDTTALKREMEAIKDEMQKLAAMQDSAEKRAQQEQLSQRLNQMSEGLKQAASSPQMQAALQRAMEQLDMSKLSQMSKEALEAAQQSMNLSQQELENLAQAMKDQQSLEDALKNLQMAKQLASDCKLDGGQCKNCNGQGDYAALYSKLMKQNGNNIGPGMGPNGLPGAGGKAPENDEAETDFKPERSPTQLTAGKTLLQWKTQEMGPTGARTEEYREAVRQVKQGVSEAIAAEQVPPGYHTAIQKYFDTLPEK
jgi:DNA repair exonuclease SbcCD ATPase subunit